MRKQDYASLAEMIKRRVTMARQMHATATEPERLHEADSVLRTFEEFAHEFAGRASVDRAQFLQACGF